MATIIGQTGVLTKLIVQVPTDIMFEQLEKSIIEVQEIQFLVECGWQSYCTLQAL